MAKLAAKVRKATNKELSKAMEQGSFNQVPLGSIFDILKFNDVMPLQVSGKEWTGLLFGAEKKMRVKLGDAMAFDMDKMTYDAYTNAVLSLVWNKQPDETFLATAEIVDA